MTSACDKFADDDDDALVNVTKAHRASNKTSDYTALARWRASDSTGGEDRVSGRTTFARWQLEELEATFAVNHYPSAELRKQLSRTLGLPDVKLQVNKMFSTLQHFFLQINPNFFVFLSGFMGN